MHLSLSGINDEATRERLQSIPTGLSVPDADVDALIAAGEAAIKTSPEVAEVIKALEPAEAMPIAEQWRLPGPTYSEICGRLQRVPDSGSARDPQIIKRCQTAKEQPCLYKTPQSPLVQITRPSGTVRASHPRWAAAQGSTRTLASSRAIANRRSRRQRCASSSRRSCQASCSTRLSAIAASCVTSSKKPWRTAGSASKATASASRFSIVNRVSIRRSTPSSASKREGCGAAWSAFT